MKKPDKSILDIDKNNLDLELIRQPSMFLTVSESYVVAVDARDIAKNALALTDAVLYSSIRKKLESSGRVTETMIQNGILTNSKHTQKINQYLKAKLQCDKALALKESLHQKSYMIRELCQLYITGYFANSSVSDTGGANSDVVVSEFRRKSKEKRDAAK